MAAAFGDSPPWEYWQVQFAEKGICQWPDFDSMPVEDVHQVIAVWDGLAKAEEYRNRKQQADGSKK
jgi:hypothetical protein